MNRQKKNQITMKLTPALDINPTWDFAMNKYTVETKLKAIELYENSLGSR